MIRAAYAALIALVFASAVSLSPHLHPLRDLQCDMCGVLVLLFLRRNERRI